MIDRQEPETTKIHQQIWQNRAFPTYSPHLKVNKTHKTRNLCEQQRPSKQEWECPTAVELAVPPASLRGPSSDYPTVRRAGKRLRLERATEDEDDGKGDVR